MSKAYNYSKEEVLEAIKGSGSIMTAVAKRLKCDWATARAYVRKWEETKQAWDNEGEHILDMAESKLYQSIQEGNTQDAKWLLATKGKRRGFSERHEITGADGEEMKLEVNVNFVKGKS